MPDNVNDASSEMENPSESPVEKHSENQGPVQRTSRVQMSFDLTNGTCIQFTVEALPVQGDGSVSGGEPTPLNEGIRVSSVDQQQLNTAVSFPAQPARLPGEVARRRRVGPSETWQKVIGRLTRLNARLRSDPAALASVFFAGALVIYMLTRLIGLAKFPIFFFTDEAVQTMLAADLVRDDFKSYDGVFLPTYFKNGSYYNLSASVYLQVLPYALFGKSVFVTRFASVLVTLLAAACVGLILRDIFKMPYWWGATLLLSVVPSWFLHSRTAFETVIFVAFYAATLYFYLLYRTRSPGYLYATLVFAALSFYSYSPGQVVIAVTGLLLFFSDLPYHWTNRATALKGVGLLLLLAVPYIRFRFTNSSAPIDHLRNLGSYWIQPGPVSEKLSHFIFEYGRGLSISYWYVPNQVDLSRHLMKGYGHLMAITLPFALLGLGICLWNIRSSASRTLMIALLAAPVGSALVGVGITRVLVFVIPATLLTGLGLSSLLKWLEAPFQFLHSIRLLDWLKGKSSTLAGWVAGWRIDGMKMPAYMLSIALFVTLSLANLAMLRDALVNGPTWFSDFGLGGMQYGAEQIFAKVQEYTAKHPDMHIILSPSWSNGTDVVARFFLGDPLPIELGSIEGYLNQKLDLTPDKLFIMIPEEYEKAVSSGKLTDIQVEQTVNYPNGQPGFYFVRTRYVDNIDQILGAEHEQRRQLLEGEVVIGGEVVKVRYSHLDMGDIGLVFDGDPHGAARTWEANPFVIELYFPEPREIRGLSVIVGSLEARVTALLYEQLDGSSLQFSTVYQGSVDHPEATLDFGTSVKAQVLRLEVQSVNEKEPAHVHIWEVTLH
jgi:hypothetical protein